MSENGSGATGATRRRLSRREILAKGARVGGTLLWVAPAIQSLSPPAYAHVSPGPNTCCECRKTSGIGRSYRCFVNDPSANTEAACSSKCSSLGTYTKRLFHQGTTTFRCADGHCRPKVHT